MVMEKSEGEPQWSAGQDRPALSSSPHSASPDGCDNVRVFQVPLEKLAEIERTLARMQIAGFRSQKENAETLKSEIKKWMAAGAKLAGLFIIAACVSGEFSPGPHTGESYHAHGGHENKRVVVRRPVVRKKSDDADPKPLANDEDGRSKLEDGVMGCKTRVDLCENRTEDGVCLVQDRLCRWIDRDECEPHGPPDENLELLSLIDRKISAVQKDVGELRRAKLESPDVSPPSDHEAGGCLR